MLVHLYRLFQSTLPVWGATGGGAGQGAGIQISIHAPRVGSEDAARGRLPQTTISIHAPRVGSDQRARKVLANLRKFQSTLPVWGATLLVDICRRNNINFNPRSPCGERPARPDWEVR